MMPAPTPFPRLLALLLTAALFGCHMSQAAVAAGLEYPISVVAKTDGTIFVADRQLPGIWVVRDGKSEVFFEASKVFRTPLNAIRCLALDADGNLLAGDSGTRQVYRFDNENKPQPLVSGATGIGIPVAISTEKSGDLLVVDLETQRLWRIPAAGGAVKEVIQIPGIRSVTIDSENRICVLTNTAKAILRIDANGEATTILGERTFQYPQQILPGPDGTLLVSDGYAKAVWKVTPEGRAEKWSEGAPLLHPVGMSWSGKDLLVTDSRAKTVFRIDTEGKANALNVFAPAE